ncbi:hypothetical protein RI367_006627 [Sorochytrium milnesiophthora]
MLSLRCLLLLALAAVSMSAPLPNASADQSSVNVIITYSPAEANTTEAAAALDFTKPPVHAAGAGLQATSGDAVATAMKGAGGSVKYQYTIISGVAGSLPKAVYERLVANPQAYHIEAISLDGVVHTMSAHN